MAHSFIAPSAAHIWGKPGGCRAYPMMAATYPDEETDDARLGTLAHEAATTTMRHFAKSGQVEPSEKIAGSLPESSYHEAVDLYVEYCVGIMRREGVFGGPMLRIEEPVAAPSVHDASFGTPDFVLFNRDAGRVYIADFKAGLDLVEAYENWQLINYFAGVVNEFDIDGYVDQQLEVVFAIVQPRGFHSHGPIREWRTTAAALRPYVNHLAAGAAECFEPDPLLRSGPHCRYCPARLHCPVAARAGLSIYESAMSMHTHDMTPAAVGLQYLIVDRALGELKSLHEALQSEVESLTRQGHVVPHWHVEPAYGRTKWAQPDDDVIALGEALGLDLNAHKAITPAQAIKAGLDPDTAKALSHTPRNGWKVVADTINKAKRVFTQ